MGPLLKPPRAVVQPLNAQGAEDEVKSDGSFASLSEDSDGDRDFWRNYKELKKVKAKLHTLKSDKQKRPSNHLYQKAILTNLKKVLKEQSDNPLMNRQASSQTLIS